METKNKILLTISWYIGLIAFIGGWSIFLVWSGGRYIGAWDFNYLEIIGFFWIFAFFWLSLIALVLLLVYVVINRKILHFKMLFTGVIILINIPSVYIILSLQGAIENKVFIKLTNQSTIANMDLKLHGNLKTWNLGHLDHSSSNVFNYDPPYWYADDRQYQNPDSLKLIITHDTKVDSIEFPALRMGECKHFVIDETLKIKSQ